MGHPSVTTLPVPSSKKVANLKTGQAVPALVLKEGWGTDPEVSSVWMLGLGKGWHTGSGPRESSGEEVGGEGVKRHLCVSVH